MSQQNRCLKDYLLISLKGMAMGAADIVPGVSGGTIALITGVYQELLVSLKNLTPVALLVLFKEGPKAFWAQINGNFLLALFGGILLSIKTLASVVSWCLEHQPLLVWAAFSGLIAASLFSLGRQQSRWGIRQVLLFLAGTALVVGVAIARPSQVPGTDWMLFLGGFIAICAMILPGISGSFILLLIGLYPVFLRAVQDLDIMALASFGIGCVMGLLLFSRFLSWLLARWYQNTLAVMLGFLFGSLYVTWPWKQVVEATVDRHGEVIPLIQSNIMPWGFLDATGQSPQLTGACLFFILGFALVLLTEFVSNRYGK